MVQRAVLLAAGRGTRLGALTEETPKCLLKIAGRALIDRQLETLAGVGIRDVTVVAGFMSDAVARHVGARCRVIVSTDYATTGSIASLALAAPHLRGHGFLLQNADTLYPVDLVRRLHSAPRESACLVDSARPYRSGEYHVEVADGRVRRYSNRLPADRSVGESAQLLRVGAGDSTAFLDRVAELISSNGSHGFPNQAYDVLMNGRGGGLWPVFTAGLPWWEIDSADDLARCNADHLAITPAAWPGRASPPPQSQPAGAEVDGPGTSIRWGRLRWVPPTIGPMVRHPFRVAREIKRFMTRQLTLPGLDLAVNGEGFLRLVFSEADALGLHPMLLWGTLLGCVREGGFIRGDQDIDLGIMGSEADRLPALRDRLARHGLGVRIENDCKLSLVHPRHPRLYVDIDVIRPHRDGWAITNGHADPHRRLRYHFPADVFAGTRTAAFLHRLTVRVPQDAPGFLAAVYGDWRTPAGKVDFRYGPLNTEVELVSSTAPKRDVNAQRVLATSP